MPAVDTSKLNPLYQATTGILKILDSENDELELKKLIRHYEQIGKSQIAENRNRFIQLQNLANGVLNKEIFFQEEIINDLQMKDPSIKFDEEKLNLKSFPIVSNVVNRIIGELDKKYLDFDLIAVNPEAINEITERKESELKSEMFSSLNSLFSDSKMPSEYITQKIDKKINDFRSFRLEIEEWGNAVMQIEDEKFNFKQLQREIFKELLSTNHPYVHVELNGLDYYPELLDPKNCFSLKSPNTKDASEYTMFGWFSYEDFSTILNKYQFTEEQKKVLETWAQRYYSAFAINGQGEWEGKHNAELESLQNMVRMRELSNEYYGYDQVNRHQKLIRVTKMYFLVPKKIGVLYTMNNGDLVVTEVDDKFVMTRKPKYKYKDKTKENLIDGEHVEWTFINELWKCIKLDNSYSSPINNYNERNSIYLMLEKNPIQHKSKSLKYGIRIPVHGGPDKNISLVEKGESWQYFYDYVWNRNEQILSTEIGKFLILNQNMIPQQSFDGSWGENNLLKAFVVAKDLSLMPVDRSLINGGNFQDGFGQMVDLSKTTDILEKTKLALEIKRECYEAMGINPQFMSDISPYQSAQSLAQGQQTTITQLHYLFARHSDIIRNVRETMLEIAQYLTKKGQYRELTYINNEKQRIIFRLNDSPTMLWDLGLYVKSDIQDSITVETIKQLVLADNTMGANALEKAMVLESESKSELIKKLEKSEEKKQKEIQAQREHEAQMQQQKIQAEQDAIERKIQNDNDQAEKEREKDILVTQIDALKFAEGNVSNIREAILNLQEANLKQRELYSNVLSKTRELDIKEKLADKQSENQANQINLNHQLELRRIQIAEKEAALREKELVIKDKAAKNKNKPK